MQTPFRMVVYAIAAVAITALAYTILLPWLFPLQDNIGGIENSLKASETGLGKSFSKETLFQEGEGFSGETFDTRHRNAAFQCNKPSLCCPQTKECSLPIEWDNRQVTFNQKTNLTVTTRCELQYGLYACTVYLGEKPAQLQIDQAETPEQTDLSQERASFKIKVSNTGDQQSTDAKISIEIFELYLEEGKRVERKIESASETQSLGSIKPRQNAQSEIPINLSFNGNFRAKIKAFGPEAGYDEKTLEFKTTGASEECRASYCESPILAEEKCTTRCYCQQCAFGSNCAEKLLQAVNVNLGLGPDITLENAEPNVKGSNIVDMHLEKGMCPSDITLEEANAPGTEIGFTAKNISVNPVQNQFTVNAYLYYGTASQQKIGTATVSPEEINESGKAVKSIPTSLEPGTYQVVLEANQDPKTERETDYENNQQGLTLEIPPGFISGPEQPVSRGWCCGLPIFGNWNTYTSDASNAITLREAVEQEKVRVKATGNTASNLFAVNLMLQNMTLEQLKIAIPTGQIFVSRDSERQNLAKIISSTTVEVPPCTYWEGVITTLCLNKNKKGPKETGYDTGTVITEEELLKQIESGSQEKIWAAVESVSESPGSYGSQDPKISKPIDLTQSLNFTDPQCEAAGIITSCPIEPPVTDPKDVRLDYCFP